MAARLSSDLKLLVNQSVALLGDVLRRELGDTGFDRIENCRRAMKTLRRASQDHAHKVLSEYVAEFEGLTAKERMDVAKAYTLMLELMNTCENAYRNYSIKMRLSKQVRETPDSIIYVLTAHPTEARSPHNIAVFRAIQALLTEILGRPSCRFTKSDRAQLFHWLELAWKSSIVRSEKPLVSDEAEHVYSLLLQDDILRELLRAGVELTPVYVRSWVGGDKDGHPGVDENTFQESLNLSRKLICRFIQRRIEEVSSVSQFLSDKRIETELRRFNAALKSVTTVSAGDGRRILRVRERFRAFLRKYAAVVGALHPSLLEIRNLLAVFPALVVPLEFRESSDVLMAPKPKRKLAIERMLRALFYISKGADPRWYVRGFVISMASDITHIRRAADFVKKALGAVRIPVVPLFEQATALKQSTAIVNEMLSDKALKNARSQHWGGFLEVMVGYSDSAKETGVLPSRLEIAQAMHELDIEIKKSGATPLFFQGSGGSTDRGGGTIPEQTAWWPQGALNNYKVTLQGEMVERSFASPEITRGQIERIVSSAGRPKKTIAHSETLKDFAANVAGRYRKMVRSSQLLTVIEHATPYQFLGDLKIGSRPTKRTTTLTVDGLRAIPWVMCWTQTRVLFPTWWGVGSAWKELSPRQRRDLQKEYKRNPLFATFVRALDFTLLKVELPVWRLYLERSGVPASDSESVWTEFRVEFDDAKNFVRAILGKQSDLKWRPWLAESIILRAPMIHPLNLLQILAMESRNMELLRVTVAGISSGMMTTG